MLTGGLGAWGPLAGDLCWVCFWGRVWNSARGIAGGGVGGRRASAAGARPCGPGWSRAAWVCCFRFWNVWALSVWDLSAAWVRLLEWGCAGECWTGAMPPWRVCLAPFMTGCVCVPWPCGGFWMGAAVCCWAMWACGRWLGSAKALVSAACSAVGPCCAMGPCNAAERPTEACWLMRDLAWGLLPCVASCLGAFCLLGEPLMSCWALSLCACGCLCEGCVASSCLTSWVLGTRRSAERLLVGLDTDGASCLGGFPLRETVWLGGQGWNLFVILSCHVRGWEV